MVRSTHENRAGRITRFRQVVARLEAANRDADPAASINTVLTERPETASAFRAQGAACYGALFQMVMEGRQPLGPRLAFPEFLMSQGLPVTFLDLGLEGADNDLLRSIAAEAAALTAPQAYPVAEEDFLRVLIQLDNLGGKFGRQQNAAYLARKFADRPDMATRLDSLRGLRARTLAFFGDSQTDNRHWSSPGHYPNILLELFAQRHPGLKVVNAGIGGDHSGEGLERIEPDVLSHEPNVCFVFFGGNDSAFYGRNHSTLSPDQFQANTKAIIERLQAVGCRVVLVTYPDIPEFGDESAAVMAEMMRRLASLRDSFNTGWLDVRGAFAPHDTRRVFAVDMVHFSPQGHFLIAEAVIDWLLANGE